MLDLNRNSHFATVPQVNMQRSTWNRVNSMKTSFNSADIIPLYVTEILPGDTVDINMAFVVRQSTPIHPVMDNADFSYMWFFCPNRLVWDDFEHFITDGRDRGAWDAPQIVEHPMIQPTAHIIDSGFNGVSDVGFQHKSLADYMGIPVGIYDLDEDDDDDIVNEGDVVRHAKCKVNALPFRAYAKIWNDWFRASTIQEEILIPSEVNGVQRVNMRPNHLDTLADYYSSNVIADSVYGGKLLRANKYFDYFTSALIEPQAGEPVGIPLTGVAPVISSADTDNAQRLRLLLSSSSTGEGTFTVANVYQGKFDGTTQSSALSTDPNSVSASERYVYFNHEVDLANSLASVSINDLRHAIAVQHILEIDARSGFRYTDLLQGHFAVTSPDARLQRTEYLGGSSVPINMDQVLQTSSTDGVSPQGNTAAFSLTTGTDNSITHSFTEHGILMCVGVVRHKHTYQQGLNRMWSREDRLDYYWPSLANISEMPIKNREIFVGGTDKDDDVFGYQEAWAEYRYMPSYVTGAMRSNYPQSLDVWHYADYYTDTPALSPEWLLESPKEIDRTLAVSSSVEDQFIGDFAFNIKMYRCMPMYSIPGLDRL